MQANEIQENSHILPLQSFYVHLVLTLLKMCKFYYMFITEVIIKGDFILECIMLITPSE